MALVLQEKKFNEIKGWLDKAGKTYVQAQIAARAGVGQSTVSKVKRSKNYNDYLKQFTTLSPAAKDKLREPKPENTTVEEPKSSRFSKIKSWFKRG